MTKKQEEIIDPSLYEDAYYEDPELTTIKEWVEKLYGEFPMLKSSSSEIYSIHPHKILHFHQKIKDFLDHIKELPDGQGYHLSIDSNSIGRNLWKTSVLDFVRHLENIWMISGPVNGIIKSDRIVEGKGESAFITKDKSITYVCEMPFVHRKRIDTFRISLFNYLFTYKNDWDLLSTEEIAAWSSNDSSDSRPSTTDSNWNDIIPSNFRRNRSDVMLGGGTSVMSWVLFEKILGLLDEYWIIGEFEENPELTKKLSDSIWIIKDAYLIYRIEYFLLNIWALNEPGFWWRILSFFESHYSGKLRFIDSLRRLLLSEILPSDLSLNVKDSPAASSELEVLNFWDIYFFLGENGYVQIGTSEPINAKSRDISWKMVCDDGTIHPVPVNLYDFKSWIKLLYAIVRYGEDYLWKWDIRVYTGGTKSLVEHIYELAEKIPKIINNKRPVDNDSILYNIDRVDNLVSLANSLLKKFNSEMTMWKKELGIPWVTKLRMKDGKSAPILARKKMTK